MLGTNIKNARKANGLTLVELAEKIGSTSGTISHIEKGSRNPSLDMLNKIAEALDLTALDLMAGDSIAENNYFNELNAMAFPDQKSNKKYVSYDILDDSMENSGIKQGYRVLVQRQNTIESEGIALVKVNGKEIVRRVKNDDGHIIIYSDNPKYAPIVVKKKDLQIIGKVIKVEFDPNK